MKTVKYIKGGMKEIRQRITKKEWEDLGGFGCNLDNIHLYRLHNGKHWVYWKIEYIY